MSIYWFTGYYCSGGAASPVPTDGVTGNICPLGYFCPMGSASPVICPDGTYSNATGKDTWRFYSYITFIKKNVFLIICFLAEGAEVCDECPPGTYCLSGEGVQPCPAGHYCLGGGVEAILPCPPGTYSPQFGLSQVEQCLICPAGESVVSWMCLVSFSYPL